MYSNQISQFLSFIKDCEQRYRMAVDDEEEMNRVTQDILHDIELEEHSYHEFAKLSKQLKEVRENRRKAKDTMKVMLPIVNWAETNANMIKSIERLLGEVRKAEKSLENRVYVKRSNPK